MFNYANKSYSIEFDEQKGCIISLKSLSREFVGEVMPLFEVALRDKNGKQERINTYDMTMTECGIDASKLVATYEGKNIKTGINISAAEQIEYGISVEVEPEYVIEWVNYPQIAVPNDLKDSGGDSKILWGFNEGVIVDDIAYRQEKWGYKEPAYPSEGIMGVYPAIVETQLMAYFDNIGGLYLAAHDSDDNVKGIDFYPHNKGIKLQFMHFTGSDFGKTYEMPYPMVMKFFKGDWYEAAEIYRSWFREKRKGFMTPIKQNKSLPEWYGESPVVITYPVRGLHDTDEMKPNKMFPYCEAMKHIERLEKELDSKIMVILMHWEGSAPWAPPYVWPPYGGETELKLFIDELHRRGDVFGVYCSGLGWTQQSNLVPDYNMEKEFAEKGLERVMLTSSEQVLTDSHICIDQRRGYDMCPAEEFTVEVLKKEVKSMIDAEIDYIQLLDQNHGGSSYFCYSQKHNHPPVPGKWQVDAMRKLLAEVTGDAEKLVLGCESAAAESYIPQLLFSDKRYNLCYNIGMPVPLYAYLYHEYVNNFMGNQVITQYIFDHRRSPENLAARIAYSFVIGDMFTIVLDENGDITWNWGDLTGYELPEQTSIKTLIKNLNIWRRNKGKEYLHTGEMVKSFKVTCDYNTFYTPEGYPKLCEKVYTSAWKSNKSFGQILVNYNAEAIVCEIELPDNEFNVIQADETILCKAKGKEKITIAPFSAILIETAENK